MWSRVGLVVIFAVVCRTDRECHAKHKAGEPLTVFQLIKPKTCQRPPIILPLNNHALDKDGVRKQALVRPAVLPPAKGLNPLLIAESSSKSKGQSSNRESFDLCKTCQSGNRALDAVSLAVAFRLAQEARVEDDRLFYGFRTLPVESPCIPPVQGGAKCLSSPEEENIYALNGQVVELPPSPLNDNLSEEAAESLLDLGLSEEVPRRLAEVPGPSPAHLGYCPLKVVSANLVANAKNVQSPTWPPVACSEGYQEGSVAYQPVQTKILKKTRKTNRKLPQNLSVLASLEQRTSQNLS